MASGQVLIKLRAQYSRAEGHIKAWNEAQVSCGALTVSLVAHVCSLGGVPLQQYAGAGGVVAADGRQHHQPAASASGGHRYEIEKGCLVLGLGFTLLLLAPAGAGRGGQLRSAGAAAEHHRQAAVQADGGAGGRHGPALRHPVSRQRQPALLPAPLKEHQACCRRQTSCCFLCLSKPARQKRVGRARAVQRGP